VSDGRTLPTLFLSHGSPMHAAIEDAALAMDARSFGG
jgi:aromatic ring-opening dioxygenase catalytic subunit (LigB family)